MAEYITVDGDTRERLVNVLLAYNGTPRHRLFEYPYTGEESHGFLTKADRTVTRMLAVLNEPVQDDRLAA